MKTKPDFPKSRPVVIESYKEEWPEEFAQTKLLLQKALGDLALRIDHIGSTSVPGLAAKDVIDIQITVRELEDPAFRERLVAEGFQFRKEVVWDNFVGIADPYSPELKKKYARELLGGKRTHIHIRETGRFNQQFPLLFRDYLRSSDNARKAYEKIKYRLAALFPESIEGYLYIKDPVMDLIYEGAVHWATHTGWAATDSNN